MYVCSVCSGYNSVSAVCVGVISGSVSVCVISVMHECVYTVSVGVRLWLYIRVCYDSVCIYML